MKKLLFYACVFTLLGWAILTGPRFDAVAGTISITPFLSGNDVTIAALETQRETLQNVINGNIEGGTNIKANSLVSKDFSNGVSIVKFRDEAFNDFTFTGMLPATSANLTSDISEGISYVNGVRIQNNAQSHSYTASKDTYVYIDAGGSYVFQEVANGAAAPSTPTNSLLLAKVVTSGTAISGVSDMRTTSINITVTSSNYPTDYRNQAAVSRDTATTFHVEPGNISLGNIIYSRTSDTSSKSVTTGTNWVEGSYPTGYNGTIFMYAYNDAGSTFDFKYSSADPVYSDTSSGANGILRYYSTGGTTYRALGWAYLSSDQVLGYMWGNAKDPGLQNAVVKESADDISTSSASYVPLDLDFKFYSWGNPVEIAINAPFGTQGGTSNNGNVATMIDGNNASVGYVITNSANPGYGNQHITGISYAAQGLHTVKWLWKGNGGGQINQRGSTDAPRRMIVREI